MTLKLGWMAACVARVQHPLNGWRTRADAVISLEPHAQRQPIPEERRQPESAYGILVSPF